MGLLDIDLNDPQQMGLLSAAAGMMNASGPSTVPHSLGQVLSQGFAGYVGGSKSALDQQKEKMQMDMLKQQIAQATRKNSLINDMLAQYSGGGNAAVGGDGMQSSSASQGGTTKLGMINGIPQQAIAHDLAFNDGKHVGEWMFKLGSPDMQVHNGYAYDKNKVQPGFLPGINVSQNGQATVTGVGPDGNPVVYAPPGAVNTYRAYQEAEARAKANMQPLPLDYADATGRPLGGSVGGYLGGQTAAQGGRSGAGPQGLDVTKLTPAQAASLRKQDPEAFANGVADFAATSGALQSAAEKQLQLGTINGRQQTQQKLNDNWITSSYNPVLEAGKAANAMTASLDALKTFDLNTGWGTEAQANAANVLTSLGVAPNNAKLFATNAQKFQSIAMDRLLTNLQAQKGPQTEGDSTRAQQTFAQLKNTPAANQFIADFARAKANQDARRAQFYQEALPLAQQEGDLNAIDRRWSNIQGSIWADPVLQPYVRSK